MLAAATTQGENTAVIQGTSGALSPGGLKDEAVPRTLPATPASLAKPPPNRVGETPGGPRCAELLNERGHCTESLESQSYYLGTKLWLPVNRVLMLCALEQAS